MEIRPIAHIHNDFKEKFGLPRQSGMAKHLISEIVMDEGFRQPDAFRGIENFSHLWLIWEFEPMGTAKSDEQEARWQATVRPPKLGGNERIGVFATLILKGVEDVNVNPRRKSLAVTFFTDETNADQLLADIRAAGIEAQVPPPHECKE